MPPFLMLIAIVFVVLLVMFGNNPMDKWKAEQEKYGKDPMARQINKFNEERSKSATASRYVPPPGATVYRLPPDQVQIRSSLDNPYRLPNGEEKMIRPAPDIPVTQWSSQYPSYMLSPSQNANSAMPNRDMLPREAPRTSLLPGAPRQ